MPRENLTKKKITNMRFPLKLALSAVLANAIAAELTHRPQAQQLQNELDVKYQQQQQPLQPQPNSRQSVQTVSKFMPIILKFESVEHLNYGYNSN